MCSKDQKVNKRITVFTPAYNRAALLPRLYQSLKTQTFRDFEWVVVDDGSTDATGDLFQKILQENTDFPVRYFETENGGKHRAINRGVAESCGELFLIVDSDDYLQDNALEQIDRMEKTIPENEKSQFAGVCGLRVHENGTVIGTAAEKSVLDITMLQREQYGITGDKAETFYRSILEKYPFPTFEGERFLTECVCWDQIAFDGLKLRFFNEPIIVCEYLQGGLTDSARRLQAENPKGHGFYLRQRRQHGLLRGREKREAYLDFYYVQRDKMPLKTMAQYLGHNALWFRLYILWLRLRQKLSGG